MADPKPSPPEPGDAELLARNSAVQVTARSPEIGDCLVWTGPKRNRYGLVPRNRQAHRVAWILTNGSPPEETPLVLHRCDNRPCFRLSHLFLGTQADNMRDMQLKKRHRNTVKTECIHGHPFDEKNTYVGTRGRACRRCRADGMARAKKERRARSPR